jgi:hypothetical protein
MTRLLFLNALAAETLVEPELPVAVNVVAVSRLEICKPVARDVNEGCDTAAQYACCNQDNPDLACVCELLDMPQDTRCVGIKIP